VKKEDERPNKQRSLVKESGDSERKLQPSLDVYRYSRRERVDGLATPAMARSLQRKLIVRHSVVRDDHFRYA
jgi:hypothetical protein